MILLLERAYEGNKENDVETAEISTTYYKNL